MPMTADDGCHRNMLLWLHAIGVFPTPVAMVTVAADVTMATTFLLISNLLSAIVLLTVS